MRLGHMAIAGPLTVARRAAAWGGAIVLCIATWAGAWSLGTHWFAAIMLGLVGLLEGGILLHVLLSTRHRMLWRMARRHAGRRRRSAALIVIGLLIGSAIVSSSLVVGDSLEATIRDDIVIWLDEVDLQVSGRDAFTGQRVHVPVERAEALAALLDGDADMDGLSWGLRTTVSVRSEASDLGEPSALWLAMDAQRELAGSWSPLGGEGGLEFGAVRGGEVIINQPLADELEATVGDALVITWGSGSATSLTGAGGATLLVRAIVADAGAAAPNGRGAPALFTGLEQAQELLDLQGQINLIRASATGGVEDSIEAEQRLHQRFARALDEVLVAEDAGLDVSSIGGGGLGISRTTGLGRLDEGLLTSLDENISGSDVLRTSMLQAALLRLRAPDGTNLSGLPDSTVTQVLVGDRATWYATPAGAGFELRSTGAWGQWPANGSSLEIHDMALLGDGAALLAHADGLRWEHLEDEGIDLLPDEADAVVAVAVAGDVGVAMQLTQGRVQQHWGATAALDAWQAEPFAPPGVVGDPFHASLASDGTLLHLLLQTVGGTFGCTSSVSAWNSSAEGDSPDWTCAQEPGGLRELAVIDGDVWTRTSSDLIRRSAPASVSAQSLGLPAGRPLAAGGTAVSVRGSGLYGWNGSGFEPHPLGLPPNATNVVLWADDELVIASGSDGLLLRTASGDSGRLPLQREIAGLGRVPLLVIAVNGTMPGLPASPGADGIVLSQWAADALSLTQGERIDLVGLIAAARGDSGTHPLHVTEILPALPAVPGQPGLDTMLVGLVDITSASRLAAADAAEVSILLLTPSNGTNASDLEATLSAWADGAANSESVQFGMSRLKHDSLEQADAFSAGLAVAFLVFGVFTIVAGMLLVVNIFVMLAEERKPEMGMVRALGMRRTDLRTWFVMEGSLHALLASALGAVTGLVVAWAVMAGFAAASSGLGGRIVYGWTMSSLLAGFSAAFLVTWTTLWLTALRNSQLDVVAALRAIPRAAAGLPWWTILVTMGLLSLGAVLAVLGLFILDREPGGLAHVTWVASGFLLLLSLVPPLLFVLPRILPEVVRFLGLQAHRRVLSPRLALGGVGAAMLVWGAGWVDPFRDRMEPNETSFIVSGLFLIAAGVLAITSLAPLAVRGLGRLVGRSRVLGPVVPTALAHPLATPFRTGMTIATFALVIFSITVQTGWTALFAAWSDGWVEESQGDFELLAVGSRERPLDLPDDPDEWAWGAVDRTAFDQLSIMSFGVVSLTPTLDDDPDNASILYVIRGIDDAFAVHGGLPLHVWDTDLGDEDAVWEAVAADPTLVIVDASLGLGTAAGQGFGFLAPIGSPITVADPLNPAVDRTVRVAGILEYGSLLTAPGLFMQREQAEQRFGATPTRIYMSLPPGSTVEQREALATDLERTFVEEGIQFIVIEHDVQELRSVLFSILKVFRAYLALGLAVGVAGLAVVTIRSVSERQHQTGVLRALGFRRGMVVLGYLLELSWISLLGVLTGVAIGIGFHITLYNEFFAEEGGPFVLPWQALLVLMLGTYLLTVLATAWPVRKAAGIAPAVVLREVG